MDVDGAPEFMDADGAPEFEQDTDSLDADGAPEFEQGTDSLGGADLFIEQVDHIWVKAGAAVLLVLTLLVPFAVVFGVNILLWVWWGMGAAVYISLRLMRYTNDSLSSQPDHVLLMLLIVTVRYPFLWSVSVQGHTWLLTLAQLCVLFANNVMVAAQAHGTITAVVFLVLLQLCSELMYAAGNARTDDHARMLFALSFIALLASWLWDDFRAVREPILKMYRRCSKMPTDAKLATSVTQLRRALVCLVFFTYAVFCPAIADSKNFCRDSAWAAQWAGFVALTIFCTAMSVSSSPLVPKIGAEDVFITRTMLLATNVFIWAATDCSSLAGTALLIVHLVHTLGAALIFLVALRWSFYKDKPLKDVAITVGARCLVVMVFMVCRSPVASPPSNHTLRQKEH